MEEQISQISDLEGLNSELECFISDLHGRAEALSARVKVLEEELSSARALVNNLTQKEGSLSAALEKLRSSQLSESAKVSELSLERDTLARQLETVSARLEKSQVLAAEKEKLLKEVRASAKEESAKLSAAIEELHASLNKETSRVSSITSERDDLARRLQTLTELQAGAKAMLGEKDTLLEEAHAAAKENSAELSAIIAQLRSSVGDESAKVSAMNSERDWLVRQLEEEKAASARKDALLKEARSAAKNKTDELSAAIEEARASLLSESSKIPALTSARESLTRQLEAVSAQLEDSRSSASEKERLLKEARAAAAAAGAEAASLNARLQEMAAAAAGEAEAERARCAALSEKVHNADALLKKKEFELEDACSALSSLQSECALLRRSREELGEKFSREIQAENEMLKEAQARVLERDAVIARLSVTEETLKKEAEVLKKEKQALLSKAHKKSASANSAKIPELERQLSNKESRLVELRTELKNIRAEKTGLQAGEKALRDELKARPYRAMLREAEEKLLIKEKMLAEMNSRMEKINGDFEALKERGQAAGASGYIPDFEEMVEGVAHQVANSISIIRSHAEFCAETPEADGARESLNVIVRNIVALQKKIAVIVDFSRPVIPQRSPERLAAVVSEIMDKLRSAGRFGGVKASLTGGEKLAPINIDRVRFAAAVEQLLANAVEAMPVKGELKVTLSAADGKQRLNISDDGAGIDKKNLAVVFHPFFTTRPGKMGLGLTLARNVARSHGGTLELVSEPGRGTVAVMELPAG
ncbi:MAG: hypothetical protein COT18_01785 [Elusimicrobia bacterium CG08_land_8_20_14_0_20_59_10]|nr:MAG: hypothetical protein COT18_01785 [Elusimicrobia bacterium CG08_land_8_20_14_0_20_59_10]